MSAAHATAPSIGASPVLPMELTTFVGRSAELDELERLIAAGRLVTLTGAGGSGKTRLALEVAGRVAQQHADGLAWVELAGLSDPELLPQQVSAALGIQEEGDRSATEVLLRALCGRSLLLVLDNCEHLADACAALTDALLRGCPGLKILATSREALGVAGERAWLVPPLAVPGPDAGTAPDRIGAFDAVRLFVARAQDVAPSFQLSAANGEAVARICHRLDGLPLAIELAAARVRVLTPEQIMQRLDSRFALLTSSSRTALPRHRTLRAAIDWSYDLLSVLERLMLQRLSVFADGFTLEAAEEVCGAEPVEPWEVLDLIARLVDRSLVMVREIEGAARYHLLETVRHYARERLDEAGAGEVRRRHAEYYLSRAEAPDAYRQRSGDDPAWIAWVETETGNLRAAADTFEASPDGADGAMRLAVALDWYWFHAGRLLEARDRIERARRHPGPAPASTRALLLATQGLHAFWRGEAEAARPPLEEAVALLGDAVDTPDYADATARLGAVLLMAGDPERGQRHLDEALRLSRARPNAITAFALAFSGHAALLRGELALARSLQQEALTVVQGAGLPSSIPHHHIWLGRIDAMEGKYPAAVEHFRRALDAYFANGRPWGAIHVFEGLGRVAAARGRSLRAARLHGAADRLRTRSGLLHRPFGDGDEAVLAGLRAELGPAEFEAAVSEGRALTLEQAVELAFEGYGPSDDASPAAIDPAGAAPAAAVDCDLALRVLALGSLQVHIRGVALPADTWRYAKPKELLVLLALHPAGRTREQIASALWPDSTNAQAKNSFHVTLHHLRKALGGAEWIAIEAARYRLSAAASWELDADRFEREARELLAAPERGVGDLRRVLALYRGELMEGEVAGQWVEEHRDRMRRLAVDLGLALGAALEESGDLAVAAETYHAIVLREDLNEEAHRRLMRCWARTGDRPRALRHYERLVTLLRDELDAEPEPETVSVYESLRLVATG